MEQQELDPGAQSAGRNEAANYVRVIICIRELCSLDPPFSQVQRIQSYKVVTHFAQDPQGTSSYQLPGGEMAEDILRNLEDKIASPQASMRTKELAKLLPLANLRSRKCYRFEGDTAP